VITTQDELMEFVSLEDTVAIFETNLIPRDDRLLTRKSTLPYTHSLQKTNSDPLIVHETNGSWKERISIEEKRMA